MGSNEQDKLLKYFYIILRNKKKGAPRKFIFYFQYKILIVKKLIKKVNKKMVLFSKGYNAEFINKLNDNTFKVTLHVSGNGDYLPKYSGNLDIINCAAIKVTERLVK